jgi:hypothetical protein
LKPVFSRVQQYSPTFETKCIRRLQGLLILACLTILPSTPALSEGHSARKDSVLYDFIYVGGKYQSQFAFLGRNFGQRIPFVTADLSYVRSNFWVSGSVYRFYENSIPVQSSISGGYSTEFSKKVDFNVSYTQFLIPANEGIARLQSLGLFQTTTGLDWNYLYSTLQVQVLAYDQPDVFISSQHSRYFEFNKKLFKRITVSFQPVFSFTLGTSRFYYSDDEALVARGITNPWALLRSGSGGNPGGQGGGQGSGGGQGNGNGQGNGGGQGSGNPGGGNPGGGASGGNPGGSSGSTAGVGTTDPESDGKKIGMLNWEFALPVSFQWGRFNLELSSRYAHPLNVIEGDLSEPTFIHGFDLYYHIPIKRTKRIKP